MRLSICSIIVARLISATHILRAVIILASGRPTYGIEPVAECLELQKRGGYILSYNGGNIVNAQTGEKLFTQFLPDEVIPILYRYAREKNHALLGYAGNEIITEMPDDQYVKEESRINKMNIRKVENLLEALDPHPTKLLMTGDPSDMLKAEQELLDVVGDKMDVFRSAPFFLELVPKGIDKAGWASIEIIFRLRKKSMQRCLAMQPIEPLA
jgi:hydroxymethylpyrimidine pyrophosphatase-like HAD family hydrolase